MISDEIFLGEFLLTQESVHKWVKYESPIVYQLGYIENNIFHSLYTGRVTEHPKETLINQCDYKKYTHFKFKYCDH